MPDTFERLKAALADRYAVERELGSGGMATVYLAEDLKHHRKMPPRGAPGEGEPVLALSRGPAARGGHGHQTNEENRRPIPGQTEE